MFDLKKPLGQAVVDAVIESAKRMPLPDVPARITITVLIDQNLDREVYASVLPYEQAYYGQGTGAPALEYSPQPSMRLTATRWGSTDGP